MTSNLMGVGASALGGAMERRSVIAGYSAYNCLMRPMALPSDGYWRDHGEYLASATNCSLRIADQLNGGVLLYEFSRYNNEDTYYYNLGDSIEIMLADEGYYGASGVASSYGSRVLDNLTGNVSPPISSSWSSTLPFNPADSNLWKNVWPTFATCTNDLHFFPMSEGRRLDYSYSRSWYFDLVYDVWGADIYQAYRDLVDAVGKIPLDYTVEDVLSYDTGWKYEVPPVCTSDWWTVSGPTGSFRLNKINADFNGWDYYDSSPWLSLILYDWGYRFDITDAGTLQTIYQYDTPGDFNSEFLSLGDYTAQRTRLYADTDDYVHWRNGTTRLDWKRLGIICQLERQMEITYTDGTEDTMPFRKVSGHHHQAYLAENVQMPTLSATRQGETNVFSFASLGASFSLDNEIFDTETNELSWTYPTCRAPAPTVVGGAVIGDGYYDSIYLDEQTAKDWILACVAAIATNADMEAMLASYEPVDVRLAFSLIAPSAESYDMNITAHPIDEYANGFVIVPSNSVEVASVSGMNLSTRTILPLEDYYTEWPTLAWVGFNYNYLNFGIYSDSTADLRLEYIAQEIFDNENGTIVTPAITLQSVGSGAPTNWMWQTTGLSSGGRWERTFDGSEIVWKCYKLSGADEYEAVTIDYQTHPETNWTVSIHDRDEARYGYYGNIGVVGNGSGPLPRSMSVPSYTVTWHSSYRKEPSYAHGTSDDLKNEEFFYPVGQYEGDTNDFRTISFSMSKYARAAYTYSEGRESDIMEAFDGQAWDRVYSRTRHSLQMLLSATGDSSMSDSVDICDDSSFGWESSLPNRDRRFRLASWGDATSLNNDNINRYNLLNGLSEQCRSRCSERGGMNVDATDEFARIRQQEEYDDYMSSLNRATVIGKYRISVATDAANDILLWLSATVQKSDVDGSIEVQGSVSGFIGRGDSPDPGPLPIPIGSKTWQYEIENWGASSVTNDTYYTSVRVDGRQSPVIKTLWKFKNLRDPNL